ncbi:hypothetical protein ACLBQC_32080, partial [Klebsiella pneumoniae]|uniref:hypothetical protein n=1 Tax=Klebsiella pneumoniae TaxID=573 RepID=UPI003968D366
CLMLSRRDGSERLDLIVGDPKDLIAILVILENSDKVIEYKVIDSDVGVIKDFRYSFGWGNGFFTKNAKDNFNWNQSRK